MFKVLTKSALLACTALAGAAPAFAQEAGEASAAEDRRTIDTILVTAQRREQTLQDVPVSVKAFTAEDIDRDDITELNDYAVLTPNVGINDGNRKGQADITIRGIGALGGEQDTFGVYLDGYEYGTRGRVYDIERIEVLRGPQGTTFGRNVIAGAINLTATDPDFDGVSGYITAEAGNFGLFDVEGAVNLPLGDAVAMRMAGFYQTEDGYFENQSTGPDSNAIDTFGGRVSLLAQPTDRLRLKGFVSYESYEQDLFNAYLPDGNPIGNVPTLQAIINAGLGRVPPGSLPAGPDRYFPHQNTQVALDSPVFADEETFRAFARLDYDLGPASVIWINGYTDEEARDAEDLDLSEFNLAFERGEFEQTFLSLELRLQSNGDERLDWVVGAYYTLEESKGRFGQFSGDDMEAITFLPSVVTGAPIDLTLLPNNALLFGSDFTDDIETYAVFGEVDFALNDSVNLIAGLRYTSNEITETIRNGVDLLPAPGGLLSITPLPDAEDSVTSEKLTWRTSLLYAATDDLNLYGTVSTGFRAGGLQLNNTERSDFGPEEIINYELGAKAFFFGRRASVNLAVFLMEWDDIQISTVNRNNNQSFTDNASKAEAHGVELEFEVLPFEGLTLSGGVGYVETELTEFDDPDDGRLGSPLPDAPELRVTITGDYRRSLFGAYEGFVRAVYIYNDEQLTGLIEDGAEAPRFLESYERIDLRLGIERPDDWRLEAYVENVQDEIYASGGGLNGFALSGSPTVSPPQRYGVRFRKSF